MILSGCAKTSPSVVCRILRLDWLCGCHLPVACLLPTDCLSSINCCDCCRAACSVSLVCSLLMRLLALNSDARQEHTAPQQPEALQGPGAHNDWQGRPVSTPATVSHQCPSQRSHKDAKYDMLLRGYCWPYITQKTRLTKGSTR